MADEKMIITIGREHGTMGDKVAEKIRRQFELPQGTSSKNSRRNG